MLANLGILALSSTIFIIKHNTQKEMFKKKHFASIQEKHFTPIIEGMQEVLNSEDEE